jgi:hypothetical protein
MSVKFKYVLSDEWISSFIPIYFKYRSKFRFEKPLKIIISIILALLAIMLFSTIPFMPEMGLKSFLVGMFFVILIFLVFYAHKIDYWLNMRSFQKAPFRNEQCIITLSDDGFGKVTDKSEVKSKWSTFYKAFQIDNGFILFYYPNSIVWLPKTALFEGTLEETDSIIKTHIKNYENKLSNVAKDMKDKD